MTIIGIDFGTELNKIGCYSPYGLKIITNNYKNPSTPSVAYMLHKDRWVFGERAVKLSTSHPKQFIYETKMMLGRKFNDPLIQKRRKIWQFVTKDENGYIKIVIEVDGEILEFFPYEIESFILKNLVEIANIPNFVSQIIEAFGTNSWCPHCMQFVVLFNKIKKNCKPMKSKKWKSFIHEKLRHYIRVLEHEYGGHVPTEYEENDEFSSDNNDIGIDENDDLNFEEEEEFYDNNKFSFEEDDPEIISKFNISDNDEGEEFNIDV